ncbi:MAG: hypothetical protein ACYCU0_08515 [Solirubrobacteraceae bacterium]
MPEEDDFDLQAALLRRDGQDLETSVEVLAGKLEEALPGRTRVTRSGGGVLGKGRKRVREVLVVLGDTSYRLDVDGPRIEGFRQREVGGIAIKKETLDPGSWIDALGAALQEEAQRSSDLRNALELLLR